MRTFPSELDEGARVGATATPIVPGDADILVPLRAARGTYAARFTDAEDIRPSDGLNDRQEGLRVTSGWVVPAFCRVAVGLSALFVATMLLSVSAVLVLESRTADAPHLDHAAVGLPSEPRLAFAPARMLDDGAVVARYPVPPPQAMRLTLAPTLISKGELVAHAVARRAPQRVAGTVWRKSANVKRQVSAAHELPVRNPRFGRIALSDGEHQLTAARLPADDRIIPPSPRLRRTVFAGNVFNGVTRSALGRGLTTNGDPGSVLPGKALVSQRLPVWAADAFGAAN